MASLFASILSRFLLLAACVLTLGAAEGQEVSAPAYGPELQGFDYAYPVHDFAFESQRQQLKMAYIDERPTKPNGRVVVLLHGKNFCAGTWAETIKMLLQSGYRVVAPDQIGFCKSSKPQVYQFTFRQLAENTSALLKQLEIPRAVVIGHSTGGMLAVRFALLHPEQTAQLILIDPIGLEDWLTKGVPPIGVDAWYARERKTNAASIRAYEQATYYAGHWDPRYDIWVQMLSGLYRGPGRDAVAWDSALLYDMILTQPVLYELGRLQVPTVLMIGDKDITAIGKDLAPEPIRSQLGNYPVLGRAAAEAIPGAKLVEFAELGHAPQMQDPPAFHQALFEALTGTLPQRSIR